MMELLTNNAFTCTDRSLLTVVATRKANPLLNRPMATRTMLLPNNSTTKELLLNSRSTVTTKDLPSPTSIRDPVRCTPSCAYYQIDLIYIANYPFRWSSSPSYSPSAIRPWRSQ
jgi:hypothetical protein